MLTVETPVDTTRKPQVMPSFDGWYDPDSTVFQATEDERAASGELDRSDGETVRAPELVGVGGPATPR